MINCTCIHELYSLNNMYFFYFKIFLNLFFSLGGLTGAGARITGAFGDIFAKLSFDDDFIDQRQQQKVKSSKLSSKVGGFFKVRYGCGL